MVLLRASGVYFLRFVKMKPGIPILEKLTLYEEGLRLLGKSERQK